MKSIKAKQTKKTWLTPLEQYELSQCLQEHNIKPTTIRRTFTDVLPLVRLLSRYYPELIDLNYHPPRNRVQNKLANWKLFKERVLDKVGVRLTQDEMGRVARCVPGSVELLLFSIMVARGHNE